MASNIELVLPSKISTLCYPLKQRFSVYQDQFFTDSEIDLILRREPSAYRVSKDTWLKFYKDKLDRESICDEEKLHKYRLVSDPEYRYCNWSDEEGIEEMVFPDGLTDAQTASDSSDENIALLLTEREARE